MAKMFNFHFPNFRYFYPYNRIPYQYNNRINPNTYNKIQKENSNHSDLVNSKNYNNLTDIANSSITDNSSNTANNNDFLNFIPKNIGPISINIDGLKDINKPLFEFLGIRLFLDDIIIICLLIFLYQQNVKDESLYLILILLLFT